MRGLGSDNIDHRLRRADFTATHGKVRWLGMPVAALSTLQRVLVVGSNLRKDHPLFAQRIRQAVRHGAQVNALVEQRQDWAMTLKNVLQADAADWTQALANVAAAIAEQKGVAAPAAGQADATAQAIAKSLLGGERKAVLLGNAAAHHAQAESLLALAQWIAAQTGASFGYLTEAANTVGAQFVGAQPQTGGLDAAAMTAGALKAAILLNVEPEFDTAAGQQAVAGLNQAQMVVTLSPFKANMAISDVLLPISPFTETSGTFVNAEGRAQSFHAVVKPQADTRPGWKVLRVLGNLLQLPGFDAESSQDVLAGLGLEQREAGTFVARLDNSTDAALTVAKADGRPVVASIYQLDSLVRRAPALQATVDARAAASTQGVSA